MPNSPDCERVSSASVVTGSPDAGTEMIPIPSDCERVPGSGFTAGVTEDAGWETISTPPDSTHIPGASVAAGAPGPDRETMSILSYCESVPGNGSEADDPFLVGFYIDDGLLVEVRFFQDERRLRSAMESLASDHFDFSAPAVHGTPPCWKRLRFRSGGHAWRY